MRGPLRSRGINIGHLRIKEFALDLSAPSTESFDVGFIYPARPMEGGIVTARHDVPWANTHEGVLTSQDEAGVIAALEHADLSVPRSVCVSSPSDESDLLDAIESTGLDYPVVVKPNSTTRGAGIAEVHDPGSLSGHADVLRLVHGFRTTGDKSFLIQEWLPEARDYRTMVLGGKVVGAVEHRLPDGTRDDGRWKHNVHRGAETVGVTLPKSHRELVGSVANGLDIRYLGVSLFKSDGRVVVSETNTQPTIDDDAKYNDGFFGRLAVLIERVAKKS